MGQEIGSSHFHKQDFTRFAQRLAQETGLLQAWFDDYRFAVGGPVVGYELEACLIDAQGRPAALNEAWLAAVDDVDAYSPELSRFNVELNGQPLALQADTLSRMEADLQQKWQHGQQVARGLDAQLLMIGILPTLAEEMLSLGNMSAMTRYRALNEQILRLREGRPLQLDIQGEEHLKTEHGDVMLEAATTSFQLHLQVRQPEAVRFYNALQILSAPLVAISANSPLLFGKRLWQETRIPLFEQAVAVGGTVQGGPASLRRVSFGTGYAQHSLFEVFEENWRHFPLLLPVICDDVAEEMAHLRLHNGTIWRWNRPLIGFDAQGEPHLRIEHRVIPAGPSVLDSVANAALLFGLAFAMAREPELEARLAFGDARNNFYLAARHGLGADVVWLDGQRGQLTALLDYLLPQAEQGLLQAGCERDEVEYYLAIIAARLRRRQTGAHWQIAQFERYHGDLHALVAEYLTGQESGRPVHSW